jgi:hypothetical protein
VTTVAAGTHNRNGIGSVTLGNGTTYNGSSVATPVGPAPFIDSTAAGVDGADPTEAALCYSKTDNEGVAVLDPAKVAGKIVLCDRGVTARVNKSLAVQEAGGVGMVLVNTSPSSINADFHFVPTVHVRGCVQTSAGPPPVIDCSERDALKAYAATAGATAKINQSTITYSDPAPFTATFSSRGPLVAGGGDLLKPDVIAPGQDILAAVAPPGNAGRDFNLYSGTSMSAPHVAGLAALLRHRHPAWSPMAIKSALMTSGSDILDGPNTNPLVIFRQGAGHVRPNAAANPGLVFDSGFNDWVAMLCGSTNAVSPAFCNSLKAQGYSFDVSDMNVASVAIGDLAGIQAVTRRVTNVGGNAATYTPSVSGLSGITVAFEPAALSIGPGETKTLRMTFTRTTAALSSYAGGQIAPAELTLSGMSGETSYGIQTGYNGELAYAKRGLIPSQVFSGTVPDDPTDNFNTANPAGNQGIVTHDIAAPANSTLLRVSMFDAETDGEDDIDLYLYRVDPDGSDPGTDPDLVLVGSSGGGTSAEQIQITPPAAGANYRLFVHGWGTDGPDANYSLHSWVLGTSDAGNMTVTGPSTATIGGKGTVNLSWAGLEAGKRYLGQIRYMQGTTTHGTTIVRVDS